MHSGIQLNTAGSWIQLDTYGYSWIQWDSVDLPSAAKLLDIDIDTYRIQGYRGIPEIW